MGELLVFAVVEVPGELVDRVPANGAHEVAGVGTAFEAVQRCLVDGAPALDEQATVATRVALILLERCRNLGDNYTSVALVALDHDVLGGKFLEAVRRDVAKVDGRVSRCR